MAFQSHPKGTGKVRQTKLPKFCGANTGGLNLPYLDPGPLLSYHASHCAALMAIKYHTPSDMQLPH